MTNVVGDKQGELEKCCPSSGAMLFRLFFMPNADEFGYQRWERELTRIESQQQLTPCLACPISHANALIAPHVSFDDQVLRDAKYYR